jgi:Ca2+-binding EF-hand superfamily protein
VSAATFVKIADTNKSGEIDPKEFDELLNKKLSFHITFEEVQEVFALIDTSKNGSISVS